jgi:hypothetical protein
MVVSGELGVVRWLCTGRQGVCGGVTEVWCCMESAGVCGLVLRGTRDDECSGTFTTVWSQVGVMS